MATEATAGLDPITAIALVGALGVGSQWLAWRLRMPAIVLMLAAGLIVGPGLGVLNPSESFGSLLQPIISIAVAIILFEGGLSLRFHDLKDAASGVRRLVVIGAPLGWLSAALALHYVAGLSWATAAVFGGIMIVTGPTVIAPLLRQARLRRRPAALLNWEAIVNDPVGALAAVLAFEVVLVLQTATSVGDAVWQLAVGIIAASIIGVAAGWGLARAFSRGQVPEYMKVPVLFVAVIAAFTLADTILHEAGLLAVTLMGLFIANVELPSYVELRRFKEHATIMLVSGVFILLAANMDRDTLMSLDINALLLVVAVVFVARPVAVMLSLAFSDVPKAERILIAFTGPRGVVLVAVAGLFGQRLASVGIEDGAQMGPLAFALVAATVVLNGFTLSPFAKWLGLTAADRPGVMIVGSSKWSVQLAKALEKLDLPVVVSDPNHGHLRTAREAGVEVFFGDILSKEAEDRLDLVRYEQIIAATDNDAYNTLVATDLGPEFGRDKVHQIKRVKSGSRHTLPATLGGRPIGGDETYFDLNDRIRNGWEFRTTKLSEEFTLDDWRAKNPDSVLFGEFGTGGALRFLGPDSTPSSTNSGQLIAFGPMREERKDV